MNDANQPTHASPPKSADLPVLVKQLGDPIPMEQKHEAEKKLVAAGFDAIPVLIAALKDPRPYEERDIANRMNLPFNAHPEPIVATKTVGSRCVDLLYQIITPVLDEPVDFRSKVYSEQILQVPDWDKFWAQNCQKRLDQIHRELQPLVKRYWQEHGTTQTVPW